MVQKYSRTDRKAKMMTNADPKDEKLSSVIDQWVQDSSAWVSKWETNQVKWHKLRMRIKKQKNFPFPGCSNIRMPTIDTKINKLKGALMNVMFGVRPITQVVPHPSGNWETAKKIEKFIDHLVMDQMNLKEKLAVVTDQTLEKGFYLLKPYYRREMTTRVESLSLDDISVQDAMWLFDPQRTEEEVVSAIADRLEIDTSPWVLKDNLNEVTRVAEMILSGKEEVKFELKDVLYNAPDVALVPPERCYVPTTTGMDPQSASYLVHEFFLPLRTVKEYGKDKGWNKEAIDSLEAMQNIDLNDKEIDVKKDEREGIERLQSTAELIKIHESYGWYDINGDGVDEKCVVTVACDFGIVLRKVSLPFYSGNYPFVKYMYEVTDDRWFSHRGIPELIEDIVKEIDIQHMQKIDYGTLANSPMFMYRAGQVGENTTQFLFGQGIPVNGMQGLDDIMRPVHTHNPNVELSYEREQMLLETKVEELIGQVDSSLHSMINRRQPRTATEVSQQSQSMGQVFSMHADLFRGSFEKTINWIWELFCQYGDDEVVFSYLGQQGYENIKLSREEIQGHYKISVRGNDQNTNPAVRQNKAQFILSDTYQAYSAGLASPEAVLAARKRAYQELDVDGWEEFMQVPQPPSPDDEVKIKMEDLTDAEQAAVLQRRGIQPDVQGRALSKQQNREQEETQDLVNVVNALK